MRSYWAVVPPKREIPFAWIENYGNGCLICERISDFHGKPGIWLLRNTRIGFTLAGTAATLCGGPLPMEALNPVQAAVRRKRMGK